MVFPQKGFFRLECRSLFAPGSRGGLLVHLGGSCAMSCGTSSTNGLVWVPAQWSGDSTVLEASKENILPRRDPALTGVDEEEAQANTLSDVWLCDW